MPIDTSKNVQWCIADWQGDVYYVWNLPVTATAEEVKAAATEEYGYHSWASPYLAKRPAVSPSDLAELTKPEVPEPLRNLIITAFVDELEDIDFDLPDMTNTVLDIIKTRLLERFERGGKPASLIVKEELEA